MMTLALVVTLALATADEVDGGVPIPEPVPPEVAEPAADPDVWAGEHRRVHFGLGIRLHGGLISSGGSLLWMAQSELVGIVSIRVRKHDEVRVQLSYGGGYPDMLGGETNVSFHHAFNPRVSLGVGVFAYLSVWSMRVGAEAPLIIRLGNSRRHQIALALRVFSGTFSNLPILQWTFASQRFAIGGDLAVGYAFLF